MLKIKLLKEVVELKRGDYNLVEVDNVSKIPDKYKNFKDAFAIAIERLKRKYGSRRFVIDMANNIGALTLPEKYRFGSTSITHTPQIEKNREVAEKIQDWILNTIFGDFPFMVIDPNGKNIYYRGMTDRTAEIIFKKGFRTKLKKQANAITMTKRRYRSIIFKTGFDVDTQSVNIFHELIHYFDHYLPLDDILKNTLTREDAKRVKRYLRKKRYRSRRGHIETGKLTFLNDKNLLIALFGSAKNFQKTLRRSTLKRDRDARFARSSLKKKVEMLPRAISLQQFLRDKHETDKITVEMINDLCRGKYDNEIETRGLDEDLKGYLYVFKRAVCKDENKKRRAADALNKIAKTDTTDQTTMVAEQQKLDKHR